MILNLLYNYLGQEHENIGYPQPPLFIAIEHPEFFNIITSNCYSIGRVKFYTCGNFIELVTFERCILTSLTR